MPTYDVEFQIIEDHCVKIVADDEDAARESIERTHPGDLRYRSDEFSSLNVEVTDVKLSEGGT